MVSARVDIDNKVDLLLGGAADYVTKPFHMKELLARISVQLRKPAGLGLAIALLSVCAASIPAMRMRPNEILSKMS